MNARYFIIQSQYQCEKCNVVFHFSNLWCKEVFKSNGSKWVGIGMQNKEKVQKSVLVLKIDIEKQGHTKYATLEAVSTKSKKTGQSKDPLQSSQFKCFNNQECSKCSYFQSMSRMRLYILFAEWFAFQVWKVESLVLFDAANIVLKDQNLQTLSLYKLFEKGRSIQDLYDQSIWPVMSSPKLYRRLSKPFKSFIHSSQEQLVQDLKNFEQGFDRQKLFQELHIQEAMKELHFKENNIHVWSANLLDCFVCMQTSKIFPELTTVNECQKMYQFWQSKNSNEFNDSILSIKLCESEQVPAWLEKYSDRCTDVQ